MDRYTRGHAHDGIDVSIRKRARECLRKSVQRSAAILAILEQSKQLLVSVYAKYAKPGAPVGKGAASSTSGVGSTKVVHTALPRWNASSGGKVACVRIDDVGRVGTTRLDIERVRVSAERIAYAALTSEAREALDRPADEDVATTTRALVANALRLTEEMAPEAYDAAREAMATLGVDDRIELFQSMGDGVDTARLVLYGAPIGIELIGGYLDRLERGSLLAVFGHEIGHCLAHGRQRSVGWALRASGRATTSAERAYAMATEFTADRFGLLACKDLHAVLRLEMQTVAGRSLRSIRFDTHAYLRQCRALAEETLAAGRPALGTSHPEHYVRGYAEWLFSETDVYREITGDGPGSRSIDEVDAIIAELVGTPALARAASDGSWVGAHTTTRTSMPPDPANDRATPQTASHETTPRGVLADASRRKLAVVRETLANVASAAMPSIRRLTTAARDQLEVLDKSPDADPKEGPLEDDGRDLLARFEESKRRTKGE